MNKEPVKICSGCGAEYSLEAVTCADCGGRLVVYHEHEKRSISLKEDEAEILIRQGSVYYLWELGELLKKNGIRTAIRFHGCEPGSCQSNALYGLYVSKADEAAAREIDRAHWLRGAPEEASSFRYAEKELQGICPACSSSIPEGSAKCPECDLMVYPEAEIAICPECEAPVGDEVKRCPNCGAEFE